MSEDMLEGIGYIGRNDSSIAAVTFIYKGRHGGRRVCVQEYTNIITTS